MTAELDLERRLELAAAYLELADELRDAAAAERRSHRKGCSDRARAVELVATFAVVRSSLVLAPVMAELVRRSSSSLAAIMGALSGDRAR